MCPTPSPKNGACDDIWVMNADGSDPRQLTFTAGVSEGDPTWSPDGTKIAFAGEAGSQSGIWIMNSDGSDTRRITHKGWDPSWSPDGKSIAYNAYDNIYTIPASGGRATILAHGAEAPDWSPDGSQIVFTRLDPATRSLWQQTDLWVMHADGSDPHQITDTRSLDEMLPAWSPDGNWIVYSSTNTYAQGTASYQLYLIHPDGTGRHPITDSRGRYPTHNSDPSWQPR